MMKPKEYLSQLQAVDTSNRIPRREDASATLEEIKKAFVPFAGKSLLDDIQAEFPGLLSGVGQPQLEGIADRVMGSALGGAADSQTPMEIFADLLEKLSPIFTEHNLHSEDVRELVAIGIRDTHEPNARARAVPGHFGFVIEVNEGLWWVISVFAKIISLHSTPIGKDLPKLDHTTRHAVLKGAIKLFDAAPWLLREVAVLHLKDFHQEAFAQRLARHMKHFVVAHELAHVMLGHLTAGKERSPNTSSNPGGSISTEWQEEHEADCTGLGLILHAADISDDRERDLVWGYIGGDALFGVLNIIEKALCVCATSHPEAIQRRQKLRSHLTGNFPLVKEAFFKRAEPFGELLDALAREMQGTEL